MRRQITGFSNHTVKAIRALREKKHRKAAGKFLAEGLRLLTDARESGHVPELLVLSTERDPHPLLTGLEAAVEAAGGDVLETTPDILSKITGKDNPQGVAGVFAEFDTSLAKEFDAKWVNITKLPKLIFDHNKMVEDALQLLRYKASLKPIIFEFFDEKFTLPALQDLWEAIYQIPTDKRNFRKKVVSMGILDKLEVKDKTSSKRGAFYYIFNAKKYKKFIESGNRFSI